MAWQPPSSDAVNTNWQPPASDALQSQTKPGFLDTVQAVSDLTPWNQLRQKTLDPLGEKVAELGGTMGYPATGAAIGTAVQMAPDILAAGTSLKGLYESPNVYAQGITKTPQEIGQLMGQGEEAAGVSNKLPVRSGTLARFPKTAPDVMTGTPDGTVIPPGTSMNQVPSVNPSIYPKNTNSLLNFIQDRVSQFGSKLSPQELADYRRMLPEMFSKGEVMRGTPQYALASDLQNKVTTLYTQAIPGRAVLNQAYSVSKTLHPEVMNALLNYVQKYGKSALKEAIGVGAGIAGGKALSDLFK